MGINMKLTEKSFVCIRVNSDLAALQLKFIEAKEDKGLSEDKLKDIIDQIENIRNFVNEMEVSSD